MSDSTKSQKIPVQIDNDPNTLFDKTDYFPPCCDEEFGVYCELDDDSKHSDN